MGSLEKPTKKRGYKTMTMKLGFIVVSLHLTMSKRL